MDKNKKKTTAKVEANKEQWVARNIMDGADVSDAKQALHGGNEGPVGWYLQDAAKILTRIANLLAPTSNDQARRLGFIFPCDVPALTVPANTGSPQDGDEGEDWVGSPAQVEAAIDAQSPTLLGWYLHELGEFLELLAPAFDPPQDSRGWRLRFKREGRGRRRDEVAKMLRDDALATKLRFATRKIGKQEAAIAEMNEIPGASRASIFRKKAAQRKRR